jgi:hypothetical protein
MIGSARTRVSTFFVVVDNCNRVCSVAKQKINGTNDQENKNAKIIKTSREKISKKAKRRNGKK